MLISHRCQACGKVLAVSHVSRACAGDFGPSGLFPTWKDNGHVITAISEPGTMWPPAYHGTTATFAERLCDCETCLALYRGSRSSGWK